MSIATDHRVKVLEGLVNDLLKRVLILESKELPPIQAMVDSNSVVRRGRPPKVAEQEGL